MQQKKRGWESIINVEKLRYPILPIVKVHTLRIRELVSDLYSSNEEDDYIFLYIPLDLAIYIACFSQSKNSTGNSAKELIKQILRKQIKKEDSYAAPKNVQFEEWKLVENISQLPEPTLVFS